ncbi:L,D-transpeptidase [Caenimonas aquaedulcis]|uniref:L,D-transpeptidase n=1 Tax=Caenimonas aquaedulcis TaxID=2793270 RepID=A0A931H7R5_9BURK|nr:L,D-transpeptidase [Caenimonas aquaedulcis]MBG9390250.1 L,D-transpeptidase [Caenimonas aquaedulcis]
MNTRIRSATAVIAFALSALSVSGDARAAPGSARELSAVYAAQEERRLEVPDAEVRRYGALADAALAKAGVALAAPQYVLVADRSAWVQAILLLWWPGTGTWSLVGASPISTGLPGSFDHFETPTGVFEHSPRNPDFRAEGTLNENGIRGYGAKGMRVFDLGWQPGPKGWGDGKIMDMRLQMHATDPDVLEQRLGTAQSKGCIRIPAALNRLLDHFGVIDAAYDEPAGAAHAWVLPADRDPVEHAGRYVIVVDSGRTERPEWSPAPYIPRVRRAVQPPPPPPPPPPGPKPPPAVPIR